MPSRRRIPNITTAVRSNLCFGCRASHGAVVDDTVYHDDLAAMFDILADMVVAERETGIPWDDMETAPRRFQ
jgi:hypothetical protein